MTYAYIDPTTQYINDVKQWTKHQPAKVLCRELGIYPGQLQEFVDADDPDPGLVVRLGAMMDGEGAPQSLGAQEQPRMRVVSPGVRYTNS